MDQVRIREQIGKNSITDDKKAGSADRLSCYLYIFQDAQINISDAQFLNAI